jgi:hypothetical protein
LAFVRAIKIQIFRHTILFSFSREFIWRVDVFNGVLIYIGSGLSPIFSRLPNISGFSLYRSNSIFGRLTRLTQSLVTITLNNGNPCCKSCGSRATHLLLRIKNSSHKCVLNSQYIANIQMTFYDSKSIETGTFSCKILRIEA